MVTRAPVICSLWASRLRSSARPTWHARQRRFKPRALRSCRKRSLPSVAPCWPRAQARGPRLDGCATQQLRSWAEQTSTRQPRTCATCAQPTCSYVATSCARRNLARTTWRNGCPTPWSSAAAHERCSWPMGYGRASRPPQRTPSRYGQRRNDESGRSTQVAGSSGSLGFAAAQQLRGPRASWPKPQSSGSARSGQRFRAQVPTTRTS